MVKIAEACERVGIVVFEIESVSWNGFGCYKHFGCISLSSILINLGCQNEENFWITFNSYIIYHCL